MKALVLTADRTLVYKEIEKPVCTADKPYLVSVAFSGICGSDIPRGFQGKAYHYPLVMGHEFSGRVAEAPDNAPYPAGTRVTVFPLLPCGRCSSCQLGDYAQCTDYDYYGSRRDGGFAEFVAVPERNLFQVPDHVDLLSAAMTEPCAVALHGVEKLTVQAGMRSLVIGAGPIGNMVAQWLKLKGSDPVYISDIDPVKLETAASMGLCPVHSGKEPLPTATDCVVEACGLPATFVQAVEACGLFGQVVFMGNIHGTFVLEEPVFSSILRKELKIMGTWNSRITPKGQDDWSRALRFLDRDIQVKPLISHQPGLEDGPEIFQSISSGSVRFGKVVFRLG